MEVADPIRRDLLAKIDFDEELDKANERYQQMVIECEKQKKKVEVLEIIKKLENEVDQYRVPVIELTIRVNRAEQNLKEFETESKPIFDETEKCESAYQTAKKEWESNEVALKDGDFEESECGNDDPDALVMMIKHTDLRKALLQSRLSLLQQKERMKEISTTLSLKRWLLESAKMQLEEDQRLGVLKKEESDNAKNAWFRNWEDDVADDVFEHKDEDPVPTSKSVEKAQNPTPTTSGNDTKEDLGVDKPAIGVLKKTIRELKQELAELKRILIPLAEVGWKIRARALENQKSRNKDPRVIGDGNAAAHYGNPTADALLYTEDAAMLLGFQKLTDAIPYLYLYAVLPGRGQKVFEYPLLDNVLVWRGGIKGFLGTGGACPAVELFLKTSNPDLLRLFNGHVTLNELNLHFKSDTKGRILYEELEKLWEEARKNYINWAKNR